MTDAAEKREPKQKLAKDQEYTLQVDIGDTLQLQYIDEPERERKYVKLIGCMPGKSLIVTPPHNEGKLLLLREGQLFVVRMFSDTVNAVQGFTSHVLHAFQRPYAHFHLSYPKDCEAQVVRKAHRVDLNLIISVRNEGAYNEEDYNDDTADDNKNIQGETLKMPARMINLSTAGSQISSRYVLGEEGEILTLFMKLLICGIEKYLTVATVIRRIKKLDKEDKNKGERSYGLEFLPMEEDQTILMHSFVYEALVKGQ